jgi:hypothetical protein
MHTIFTPPSHPVLPVGARPLLSQTQRRAHTSTVPASRDNPANERTDAPLPPDGPLPTIPPTHTKTHAQPPSFRPTSRTAHAAKTFRRWPPHFICFAENRCIDCVLLRVRQDWVGSSCHPQKSCNMRNSDKLCCPLLPEISSQ